MVEVISTLGIFQLQEDPLSGSRHSVRDFRDCPESLDLIEVILRKQEVLQN